MDYVKLDSRDVEAMSLEKTIPWLQQNSWTHLIFEMDYVKVPMMMTKILIFLFFPFP